MDTIYEDIARRTGGNVYIGVVGPVRTGKSTLIKRIMETLVIPCIDDPYRRERARDELPQSGSGRMIMTSEPKFVPEEAVEIAPDGNTRLRVRLIDSVGYMVDGAVGASEDGVPRMVTTPWLDREIPMTEAAELGTRKVMEEHCSVGLVVTTDGSVTDIPREDYLAAERRAILDMQATGKPFLVIVNSRVPAQAEPLRLALEAEYGVRALCADCLGMDGTRLRELFRALLDAFPMRELHVRLPRWLDVLEQEHPLRRGLYSALVEAAEKIRAIGQARQVLDAMGEVEGVRDRTVQTVDPGTGTVCIAFSFPEGLFYEILSQRTGLDIRNDGQLLQTLTELAGMKTEYEQIADALRAVRTTGYGVVLPGQEELRLEKPELLRKGGACGVRLRATAPSIHMVRVDVATQISPMVGDEKQSAELVGALTAEAPEKLGQCNLFGRSVHELLRDGLNTKLTALSPEVREKYRQTLSRIVNEGASGLICIIL